MTIVLDGMPFIPHQFFTFQQLRHDWRWIIIEGAAANVNCTSWCQPQQARFSEDGTHAFLMAMVHPRVHTISRMYWKGGKLEMVNRAVETITEPCLLLQIDADEFWTVEQIDRLVDLFESPRYTTARFHQKMVLGPNIKAIGDDCWPYHKWGFRRAWKFQPGYRFVTHEPPSMPLANGQDLTGPAPNCAGRDVTEDLGLVPWHYAYAFESQVAYKEKFYGYAGAVEGWWRLQKNREWPVKLKPFFSWVDEKAAASPIQL